jgi:phenylacetate-coenzyme A ligase PaaK-like adenylate-forming protein
MVASMLRYDIPKWWIYLRAYGKANRLLRSQFSLPNINALQSKRLARILKHAYTFVPYYRRVWSQSLSFDEGHVNPEIFKLLPTINKSTVKRYFREMIANDYTLGPIHLAMTSGSTGEPSAVLRNNNAHISFYARQLRCLRAWQLGCQNVIDVGQVNRAQPFIEPSLFFSKVYSVDANNPDLDFSLIDNPVLWTGASFILSLIDSIGESALRKIQFRLIVTQGEQLNSSLEGYLKDVFRTDILDIYGASEFGTVAWRCPEGKGYHIDAEEVLLEVLDENGFPSTEGEIAVTCLHNTVMPIIRYRTGDIAKMSEEKCACGRQLPLIEIIHGRINDYLILSEKRMMSPYYLSAIVFGDLSIRRFQFVQESMTSINLYIVPQDDSCDVSNLKIMLERRCRRLFGTTINTTVQVVDEIEQGSLRKGKFVVSKVSSSRTPLNSSLITR